MAPNVIYSISNLAWDPTTEREDVFPLLREHGFGGVEIAPTKIFPAFWETPPTPQEIKAYKDLLEQEELEATALQSIIYGRPELQLFGSVQEQEDFLEALKQVFALAAGLEAKPLVFGSPKNRLKGELDQSQAMDKAADFFTKAAQEAENHGVILCMEANPAEYNGDFVLNTPEALELVQSVDHPGFRLHLDTGGLHLAQDDLEVLLEEATPWVEHFHVSNPFLKSFEDSPVDHALYGQLLEASGYDKAVSIEMLPPENNIEGIKHALNHVKKHY